MKKTAVDIKFTSSTAQLRKLEGNLLTLIEGLGLPEKQTEAIKSQVRRLVWQLNRD